ncbi:MAG: YjbQ family protein [Candidatus Goldbacteria bacterium]|nr:YjbQ family protein [Candidatus Goldiibacteriota bacterium]
MHTLEINTKQRCELVEITADVQAAVDLNKAKDGIVFLMVPHTTAGLTVNENADPAVKKDILKKMNGMIPVNDGYIHAEGNSDSHVKQSLFGCEMFFIVENGKLVLGTWQGIFFCEFDGPRKRKIYIKITG